MADPPIKRTDVGYKRPPREHQFKKGNKPKPRKAKPKPDIFNPVELLRDLLAEERHYHTGKKVSRATTAELIARVAMELAEAGNATMAGLAFELNLLGLKSAVNADNEPRTWIKIGDQLVRM